ncbi:MAG: cysteine--tRNA ligase [Patescibacteria group bacterium]|nr:cysteine--tRNA ligase [Patescibacteria group bacterium]
MLKFFNTLKHKVEDFKPIKNGEVGMYICGPTVYNFSHIGNLRTYIFEDIVRRVLELAGFEVSEIMNITDVEDKLIKKSRGDKEKLKEITQKYEEAFLKDAGELNIEKPQKITRATDYIEKMVVLIKILIEKGIAYKASDNSIYFSIAKFKDYGKLSGLDKNNLKIGARVDQDEYKKENPSDFVLWKAWSENDGDIFWETELGKGRPGWHIECSAMSQEKLGETFDIHAGGVDLIFPHHENEIAQSEGATDKPLANYWLHSEHLLVDNAKMSKSKDNFYTLEDLREKGYDPLDFRYLCLLAHYKTKLNFTWESLKSAQDARNRLINIYAGLEIGDEELSEEDLKEFKDILFNNFDTPKLLAKIWEILRDTNINGSKKAAILKYWDDNLLALNLTNQEIIVPKEVQLLVEERGEARANKNWQKSDELRDKIEKLGFVIEDLESGTKIKKR